MGINYSKIYSAIPRVAKHQEEYSKLRINESEIGKLYKLFEKIDADGKPITSLHQLNNMSLNNLESGMIDVAEILHFLHVEQTRFSVRVFSILDFDSSGQLSFDEFVIGCWNYWYIDVDSVCVVLTSVIAHFKSHYSKRSHLICMMSTKVVPLISQKLNKWLWTYMELSSRQMFTQKGDSYEMLSHRN